MSLWDSVILGLVQGLGEFLPISSSAHLVIFPWLLKFNDPGLSFDVALHFGTLFALVAYFWKEWWGIGKGTARYLLYQGRVSQTSEDRFSFSLFCYLMLASIPGAVAGFFLDELAETSLRHPLLVAVNMALLGSVLLYADSYHEKTKDFGSVTLRRIGLADSLIVGFSQSLALIPGVSRSGVTITAGLLRGLDRGTAARFSFLLATPITLGACILKVGDFLRSAPDLSSWVGIVVSAVIGFLSIKYLLRFVQHFSYRIFVYYRFGFALVVFVVFFARL